MFTVCPKCALTLTVTAADLRVAQGFVRCGQCTNVFNALLGLSDERQPTVAVPVQEAAPEPAPPADDSPGADDLPPRDDTEAAPADEDGLDADEDAPMADDASIEQTS